MSISRISDAGHIVTFTKGGGNIRHLPQGKRRFRTMPADWKRESMGETRFTAGRDARAAVGDLGDLGCSYEWTGFEGGAQREKS